MKPLLVRARDLEGVVGLHIRQVYRLIKRGEFPPPRQVGEKVSAWRMADLEAWADARPASTLRGPK